MGASNCLLCSLLSCLRDVQRQAASSTDVLPPEVLREELYHMIFPPTQIPHNPPAFHGVSSNVKHKCQVEVLNICGVGKQSS